MELSDYIRVLRKNWLLIIIATLVGIGVAAAYSLTRTPEYEASSTVAVSTQGSGSVAELQQGSSFAQTRINTYVGLVKTPIVLNPVIAQLDMGVTSTELGAQVSASAALNTTLITITVTDPDPVKAAELANAVAASLSEVVPQIEPTVSEGASPVRLTRVSDALPPLKPSSPNVPLNLALGALVGLALGVGGAVLRTVLDTRVRTPRDVAQVTSVPLIGAIAYDAKAKDRPLIVHADPLSPRAESFRALRTNLQFVDMGGRASFVVTSSVPSEGKSTTTINLAIALADAGKRVALLDTDLRKPKVAEYLGIEGGVGLTDVLIGRVRVGDVMLPWGGRSLYVLPAGKIPPNPSELLGSQQMQTLLEVLERDFDVVLCDAPPLLPVTDAAILAKSTSGAILAIAAGRTSRHQLSGAVEALETVGAKTAGTVLTMVPTRGPDAYYHQYGGYGYGYGYREDPKAAAKAAKVAAKAQKKAKDAGEVPPPAPVVAPEPSLPSAARRTFTVTGATQTPKPSTPPAAAPAAAPATPRESGNHPGFAPEDAARPAPAARPAAAPRTPQDDFDSLLAGEPLSDPDSTTRRRP
ncbi:polysaccharide biosynthesis tyrosine autokinase [Microbacterium sp. W1N]|uniref:polysaccharide biosynthesis tyrosine autokinase n=1 Tax=Microbacterium festucae TaxID=2977531 RepID=UPI0021C0AAA9|nr:polysaccharide biosynthesis tyrosine autokinase [Microbacterium festucae]MCT9819024.1 polysaccharide biosynthesis tyrosine autokinase [Microbacterium festucae]